jgi:meso-butanediol dehydrogenase/(S,S)-butanediol dehydrogenase/diacetyl reductase
MKQGESLQRFAGQPILISGAGRGLGEGIARHLAAEGAIVGVCDINEASAQGVAEAIRAAGGQALGYGGDLGRRQVFFDVAAEFAKEAGPLRALINNASVLVYEPIEAVSEETLDLMLSAGLKSVFWGVQAFLAHRDESAPGVILNYSSPVAYRGRANTGAYTAIKAAVAGLTKVLAGELGPRGVRVNAIAPGSVPTPATTGFVTAEQYEARAKNIPLRRNGTVEDVAKAAAFLLSDEAEFINGAMLAIDGGIIAAG